VYSAQSVADFCEVDLKTVHHWADRGKIEHHRTEGRHLRFRRNDVVRFLRAHGYPLPDALVRARPTLAVALASAPLEEGALSAEEVIRRLGSRFSLRRHGSGALALAHLVADAPDAVVLALDDPTLALPAALAALKSDPATGWMLFAVITTSDTPDLARTLPADIVLRWKDLVKLPGELARSLAVA
jgi:excisionase family DNA binding protein